MKVIAGVILASLSFTMGQAAAKPVQIRDVHNETTQIGTAMICWQEQVSETRWDKYCDYR